ncbi:MAG: hypothetical protein K0B07_01795 [DPANN group archaeon]|nr:hypothetical protein [DPANN group archaeon]
MADNTKIRYTVADDGDKDDMISKLISEKKIIKEKNVRLASLLNLVTKKISETNNDGCPQFDNSKLIEVLDKVSLLKKQVSSIEHMLEKSKIDSKVDELNKTISAMNSRVEDMESKLSAVHKLEGIENKLADVESLIKLHKMTGDNPFGMLGNVGGIKKPNGVKVDVMKEKVSSKKIENRKNKLDSDVKHNVGDDMSSDISKTFGHIVDILHKH